MTPYIALSNFFHPSTLQTLNNRNKLSVICFLFCYFFFGKLQIRRNLHLVHKIYMETHWHTHRLTQSSFNPHCPGKTCTSHTLCCSWKSPLSHHTQTLPEQSVHKSAWAAFWKMKDWAAGSEVVEELISCCIDTPEEESSRLMFHQVKLHPDNNTLSTICHHDPETRTSETHSISLDLWGMTHPSANEDGSQSPHKHKNSRWRISVSTCERSQVYHFSPHHAN